MSIFFVILIALLFSAFFSGMEIAFVSSNKLRIELNKSSSLSGRILGEFKQNSSRFITTLLIGNNIALVVFGSAMAILLEPFLYQIFGFNPQGAGSLVIQTLIATVIILLFGEFFPKALFQVAPYKTLRFFAVPLKYIVYYPLLPLTWLFSSMAHGLIRLLLRKKYKEKQEELGFIDLEYYIKELSEQTGEKEVEDDLNTDFFEKALYLKEIKVRECMVPRTEIEAIEIQNPIEELRLKFIDTKLSRLLVYEESIDQIIGYVHHQDLINKPQSIQDILFEITVVPESMNARDLLSILIKEHKSIAYVVDEYGGTSGLVTLEDIIEEIFGEIQDEHDEDEYIEKQLNEQEFVFSGRLEVDYINEKYGLNIPEGEYETLSGFIIAKHEDIPGKGEVIHIDRFEIHVLDAEDNRLKVLRIIKQHIEGES